MDQAGVRDLLAAYPTLTALRAASQSRIERIIKARSPRIAAKVTAAVAAALAAQDVTVRAEAATGRVIAELDRVCARRDALAAEIGEAFLAHPFGELLATMPGIGPRPAPGSSPRSATALASPPAASSPPMPAWPWSPASPAPPSLVRPAAAAATTGSKRHVPRRVRRPARPRLQGVLRPKRAEGKRHNAALIYLARRRCDVILAMLRTRQPYQPARHQDTLSQAA